MKSTLHFPIRQYEFIEVEVDGNVSDIISKYFEFREKFEAREKEYNEANPVTKEVNNNDW